MTNEQLSEKVMEHGADIAALDQSVKSAHHRINENDRVTEGIHKIAANVETLALQMKHMADTAATNNAEVKESLKQLGERVGALEKKPALRWEALVTQLVGLAVAAVVGFVAARLF